MGILKKNPQKEHLLFVTFLSNLSYEKMFFLPAEQTPKVNIFVCYRESLISRFSFHIYHLAFGLDLPLSGESN